MGDWHAGTIGVAVLLLAIAVLATGLVWRARRGPTARWLHTMGTVLSSSVQVDTMGRRENPLVLYAYQVNGQVFQGQRLHPPGVPRRNGEPTTASGTVARYPAGASVVVYYDPTDPANSALEL
jgi:hypothetical protein